MSNHEIFELDDGYYFWDEAGLEVGPFDSVELASRAYDAQLRWLTRDHQDSIKKMRDNFYD